MGVDILLVCIGVSIVIFSLSRIKNIGVLSRSHYITNFETIMGIQAFFVEKAYDIIHKDRLLIYSVEATKIDDKQFNEFAKDFATLVIKLMGPMLSKEFVLFYGNEETFFFNLIEVFSTKYENDEIRKTSIENLMESE